MHYLTIVSLRLLNRLLLIIIVVVEAFIFLTKRFSLREFLFRIIVIGFTLRTCNALLRRLVPIISVILIIKIIIAKIQSVQ